MQGRGERKRERERERCSLTDERWRKDTGVLWKKGERAMFRIPVLSLKS